MGERNFLRRYLFKAGPKGKQGISIGITASDSPHTLHIAFSVEKSDAEALNTAKIQLWNLSQTSLSMLDIEDCVVELLAGYSSHISLIASGNVVSVSTQMDGADMLTEIEVVDGRVELRDTFLTIAYIEKVNIKTVLDFIASSIGVSVVYSAGCIFPDFSTGFSFIGAAKDALKKACEACGLTWSIQNGVLQIRQPNEAITIKAYVLSAETGLLEVPKRVTLALENGEESGATGTRNQIGYEVKYLLNGAIGINDYVRLESPSIQGDFRVYKVTMDGDNMDGEWTCVAQLLEVKQ